MTFHIELYWNSGKVTTIPLEWNEMVGLPKEVMFLEIEEVLRLAKPDWDPRANWDEHVSDGHVQYKADHVSEGVYQVDHTSRMPIAV